MSRQPPTANTEPEDRRRRISTRLALTAGVALLGAASIAGVFANFTDTESAGPEPLTTGQVHIVLGTPAGDNGAITVGPINHMAEGDSVARVVQLTNNTTVGSAGTTGLAAVNGLVLKTSVSGANSGSDIVTDSANGLHVTVQSCATSPTEAGGASGPWTYTCSGGFTSVVNNVPLATLDSAASDITSSAPAQGASIYYVVTVSLPQTYADAYSYNAGACSTGGTAGSTEQFMNCTLSITYNFTATQRAGAVQ
jgi:predicted ribosomally synthesized peptide with SipW-like signal peptide